MPNLSGLRTRITQVLFFFFCLAAALLFTADQAEALTRPHQFYDWNTYTPDQKVLGIRAFAQEATPSGALPAGDYHDYAQHSYFLGFSANFTPTNPFYFVKRLEEGATLAFTFDAQAREQVRLEVAGERLSEMQQEVQAGNTTSLTSLSQDYKNTMTSVGDNLETFKTQGQNITTLSQRVDTEAARHTLVLEEVALQAPAQAEGGLKTALIASEKTTDTVADILGKPALPPNVITRLEALKSQGILTDAEVNKIVGVASRQDARDELRKLVEADIFPKADFRKLDETAQARFPDGYFTALEIAKFRELKKLETERPDQATLGRLQDFAKDYAAGDVIPPDLRRWWVPMVRLEELQNTLRPDLLKEELFRYRPEEQQKYKEVVERVKPRAEDAAYINGLVASNPNLLNDPAYARLKAIADKFGTSEAPPPGTPAAQACNRGAHWVFVHFMPQGGYCVPNYDFPSPGTTGAAAAQPCPPGYHRTSPESACYPDSPSGPGIIGTLPAQGICPSGYRWTPAPQTGGYCSPEIPSTGGGFPSPIGVPGYCLPGQVFRDGKCEAYNPPPPGGCAGGSYWNGQQCITPKDCGAGSYQDHTGACKPISETEKRICPAPLGGCGTGGAYWDTNTCSCKFTGSYATPNIGTIESCKSSPPSCGSGYAVNFVSCSCEPLPPDHVICKNPPSCGSGYYVDYASCSCKSSQQTIKEYPTPPPGGYPTPPPYGSPSGDTGGHTCGSGYYWNGSYCAPTTYGTPSYGTPSGTYGTPYYGTPSGTYGTPSYGTPEYGTPTYGTPEYGSPTYGTPEYHTPAYGTPSTTP